MNQRLDRFRRWPKQRFVFNGAAWLISILFLASLPACHKRETVPENTLVIGIESGPRLLDPRLSTDAASSKIGDLLFNGLVKRNDDFSIAGDLAESWETPTPTRYVFHLRKGVKFHNGADLTSKDIKAAFEFVMDPASKSAYRSSFTVINEIETPDDHTVIFKLNEPAAPFLGSLTMGIVPAGSGDEAASAPVGTGPFKFVEYKTEDKLTLTKNSDYFSGVPALDGVIFKIVPDETVRVLELEKGAIHLVMNPITPDVLPRFRANKKLNVVTKLGTNYSYLGFNLDDELAGNFAVRKALAHAIDREGIVEHILKGLAKPTAGLISEANEFYETNLAVYKHDPEKAKRILDQAGFADPDGDGPQLRFTLTYSTSQNELRKRIAEVFQWQLAKVGVGLDIRSFEWGTFYASIKKGNFQMFSLTWVGIADPDIMHYIFNTASIPPNGANRGRYRNAKVDELTERGKVTFGDERKKIYGEIQRVLADELPYVSLWHSVNVAVMDKRVTGFNLAPDENLKSLAQTRFE